MACSHRASEQKINEWMKGKEWCELPSHKHEWLNWPTAGVLNGILDKRALRRWFMVGFIWPCMCHRRLGPIGLKRKFESVQPIRIIHIRCVPIISLGVILDWKKCVIFKQIHPLFIAWRSFAYVSMSKYLLKDEPFNILLSHDVVHTFFAFCCSWVDGVHVLGYGSTVSLYN